MLEPGLGSHRLRFIGNQMRDNSFTVIENWLDEGRANDIANRIDLIQDWSARICDKEGGPRVVDADAIKAMGLTAEEYARNLPASLENLARGGTMAYLFFVKHLSQFDSDLYRWWTTDFVEMANELSHQQNDYIEEPQVTMYSSGCFLGQHSDSVGNRRVAFIANFTRDWQPDFGGCLTILQNGKWEVVLPKFNSLVLMDVRASSCHYVSQVATWVKTKRTAITGWVGRKEQ